MPSTCADPVKLSIQRRAALDKGNYNRTFRKNLKEDLKEGRANVLDYILSPPEPIHTMKLFDLLLATPKYGRVKVNRILVHTRISPSTTLERLSKRQKDELASVLRRGGLW